ncbi:MAG: restriction endonuclease [Candidatus Limnocylindria bacterium]
MDRHRYQPDRRGCHARPDQPTRWGEPVKHQAREHARYLAQLQALKPFEFQNWVIQQMHGTHAPRKSGDMGIDGYSFMLHEPIQVKQSSGVGRNVVDNFETAVERAGKKKGYIVALSFGSGAIEEVARVKEKGLEIVLLPVAELLRGLDIVTPQPGLLMDEIPAPEIRSLDAMPSVEELIASERNGHELARAAEEPETYGSN